jgi:acid stress-induced BolA-like protein IbaG/YrbA
VDITVISAEFEGLRPVARQQRVYAPLSGLIADGTLHAVNISAQTP